MQRRNAIVHPSESEFLHVRKGRVVQRIDVWPSKLGTKLGKHLQASQKLILNFVREVVKLELIVEFDYPNHTQNNGMGYIWFQEHIVRFLEAVDETLPFPLNVL
jgi:hypothetical protein